MFVFFSVQCRKIPEITISAFHYSPPPAGNGEGAMQKILHGVAPPPDLIHYPLYTIFDRKGAPFIYLPLNKGLFIYFNS